MDLGALLGAIISGTGLGIGRSGMHPQQPSDILREAAQLGVSPLALLGGQTFQGGFGASVGDPGAAGQMLGRAFQANKPADDRLQALKEQNLVLENARLQNDVVAGQMRNTANATTFRQPGNPPPRPPQFSLDEVWGSVHRGSLAPKPGLQAVMRADGSVYYIPSSTVQSGLWSPVPGLPANPQATADVVRANAASIPPDVARMSGFPPGAYPFLPGTAPSWWEAAQEGRTDSAIYGNPLY